MRNKETGEFELVVGDKQLLSGFFIGVVLLAVVFAMGYVLGRSSSKSGVSAETAAAVPNTPPEDRPQPASSPVPSSPEPVATAPASADPSQPAATPPAEQPPAPTTVPARDTAAAAPPPEPRPAPPPAPEPANGSYWQVLAGSQNSADNLSQTLKHQGFPVSTRPGGPPKNLTLVWVGPYSDKESLGSAKKKLEDVGITNLIKKP